jgi:hypothetical protein
MRYMTRGLAVAVALLLVGSSVANAQQVQSRKGFWIGFGLGYGSLGFSCEGCVSDREGALSGHLKMGGTISPKLLLGGELNGWTKDDGTGTNTQVTAGNASFAAYFYPAPAGGFFFKGGLGVSSLSVSGFDRETGVGFILGGGYDLHVSSNMSITPFLNMNWGHPVSGLSQNVYQMGAGLTWH